MTLTISAIHHVQITVSRSAEEQCKQFYSKILGLEEIPKPSELKKNGGAWYRLGSIELHLSPEDLLPNNIESKRHLCYLVPNLDDAQKAIESIGIELIPDNQPIVGWKRFYVRDPGGNRVEIAQKEDDK